jgi:4-hydroxy-tetrahydrodipicolinate synthase
MFEGIYTALITPFRDGRVDLAAFARLIERQIAAGVDGVVIAGTTGESATLGDDERVTLFAEAVRVAGKRCGVVAGTGTNDTARSVEMTREAARLGCGGALVVTPYYNRPTQEGLYHHFRTIAEAAPELPQILYNVPSRTAVGLTVETIDRLADVPGIAAIKEATADLAFGAEVVARCGDRLTVLSGDDATAFPLWAVGGRGVIAVTSNLVPERFVALWKAFRAGDWEAARRQHLALLPLFKGMFVETNPVPVKTVTAWAVGGFSPELRLPLTPLLVENAAKLRKLCAGLEIPLSVPE